MKNTSNGKENKGGGGEKKDRQLENGNNVKNGNKIERRLGFSSAV